MQRAGTDGAIATRFAQEGADVIVADIQQEPRMGGTPTHRKITEETDAQAQFVECNVTEPSDLAAAVTAAEEFGGIDIMVNNAGVVGPEKPVVELTREDYDRLFDINIGGVVFGAQKAAQSMLDQGTAGTILNMASIAGYRGGPNGSLYAMSKAAVRIFTQSLAAELGSAGIRVNAIAPGTIETAMTTEDIDVVNGERGQMMKEMTPMDRFGTPEEVGDAAVLLASDLAGYTTGHTLTVDGGVIETF